MVMDHEALRFFQPTTRWNGMAAIGTYTVRTWAFARTRISIAADGKVSSLAKIIAFGHGSRRAAGPPWRRSARRSQPVDGFRAACTGASRIPSGPTWIARGMRLAI